MKNRKTEIPVGYLPFHKDEGLNFQINWRLYSTGLFSQEELYELGRTIDNYNKLTPLMEKYANAVTAKNELKSIVSLRNRRS
jgi:hypothetical protein